MSDADMPAPSLSLTIGSFRISPITVITGLTWLALLLWLASWAARILEMRVLSLSRLTPSVQLLFSRLIKVAPSRPCSLLSVQSASI